MYLKLWKVEQWIRGDQCIVSSHWEDNFEKSRSSRALATTGFRERSHGMDKCEALRLRWAEFPPARGLPDCTCLWMPLSRTEPRAVPKLRGVLLSSQIQNKHVCFFLVMNEKSYSFAVEK